MLNIGTLDGILSEIRSNYNLASNAEITLEANPENLNAEYLQGLRDIGINRLSIGIQSFDDTILKFLKRRHTANEAIRCVETAAKCGFDNISIDLIYGIAGLSDKQWGKELEDAFSLPITHLSCYCLGIEDNTLLHRYLIENKYKPSDDETCLRQFLAFDSRSAGHGFEHYEISNACKPDMHSKHNSSYWDRSEYLGFGPGAHSYFSNSRSWNIANAKEYIRRIDEGKAYSTSEDLSPADILEETIMLGLRTAKGINLGEIKKDFGNIASERIVKAIKNLQPEFYNFDGERLSLTPKGMFVSDNIIVGMI